MHAATGMEEDHELEVSTGTGVPKWREEDVRGWGCESTTLPLTFAGNGPRLRVNSATTLRLVAPVITLLQL